MSSESSEFGKDIGLMHELVITGRKIGFTPKDWGTLAHNEELLFQTLAVIRGNTEIVIPKHLINLDADPFVPVGWSVEEHQRGGMFEWDPTKVTFYISHKQETGYKSIRVSELYKELNDKHPFNANLLDYLITHPELIPEEWKGKHVYFWGTIYKDSCDNLRVRCIYLIKDVWREENSLWIGYDRVNYTKSLILVST